MSVFSKEMSRYNRYHEGFVFRNGGTLSIDDCETFEKSASKFFDLLFREIGLEVVGALEKTKLSYVV